MPRVIAHGAGWRVADVICTCGPDDRPYTEQHSQFAVALIVAGMFQHHGSTRPSLLTSGSVMLGAPGGCFECRHDHSRGDRAVAFWYDPALLESIAADLGTPLSVERFGAGLPPSRELLPLVTRAAAGAIDSTAVDWNELAVTVAATLLNFTASSGRPRRVNPQGARRVADVVHQIDRQVEAGASLSLEQLAALARLSPFHFLRTFTEVVGETPHQYVRRGRLRSAALRLLTTRTTVLDVALDTGFADLSTFNRAFKAEFGTTPFRFRKTGRPRLITT